MLIFIERWRFPFQRTSLKMHLGENLLAPLDRILKRSDVRSVRGKRLPPFYARGEIFNQNPDGGEWRAELMRDARRESSQGRNVPLSRLDVDSRAFTLTFPVSASLSLRLMIMFVFLDLQPLTLEFGKRTV